jgi:tetratricopeptide (TPR) repeat protein
MSWFKKLFQSSTVGPVVKTEVKREVEKEPIQTFSFSTSTKSYFSGIDLDFIDLIYFKDSEKKKKFISDVESFLNKLKINSQTDEVSGTKLVAENNFGSEEMIPFLNEIISYDSETTTTKFQINGEEPKEINTNKKSITIDKLNHYYTALNLASYNLEMKVENSYFDLAFEEELIKKTLEKAIHTDYARISTLLILGQSFCKANEIDKMESTFNIIRKDQYDLSPVTISNFYRSIADTYLELTDKEKALDWFKAGLTINPKLGVKKLIEKLEKN